MRIVYANARVSVSLCDGYMRVFYVNNFLFIYLIWIHPLVCLGACKWLVRTEIHQKVHFTVYFDDKTHSHTKNRKQNNSTTNTKFRKKGIFRFESEVASVRLWISLGSNWLGLARLGLN